jgi:hypothetical protein
MLKPKSSQTVDTHTFAKEAEQVQTNISARKFMSAVFWDRKVILMLECMQQGTKMASEVYCESLKSCVVPFRT